MIKANTWYKHLETPEQLEYRFKVLHVGKEVLEVEDEGGERRILNRIIFEEDMVEVTE